MSKIIAEIDEIGEAYENWWTPAEPYDPWAGSVVCWETKPSDIGPFECRWVWQP